LDVLCFVPFAGGGSGETSAEEKDGVRTLPPAIQVHHAVCDGYHIGRFLTLLREKLQAFGGA